MNRREFSLRTVLAGAAFAFAAAPRAQGAPVEGTHYVRLSQPVPTGTAGKIDVIEFFWYGCPHCNAFESLLESWVRRLPPGVSFRRVPVAFRDEPFVVHQKIFYALEAMGQLDAMHRKVFAAIHNERMRLDKLPDVAAWMSKNGVDGAKFTELANSFSVQAKLRQAKQLADGYKIDGVPAIGVHGRYYTSGSLAGGNDRALAVADFLIERVRKA
jgi:thiol:disulfide interchange protein DsbA